MGIADHLLFGLLALQNGLIDQSQLVAAFHAWTRDKARSLADHLEAHGTPRRRPASGRRCDGRPPPQAGMEGILEKSLAAIPAGHSTRDRLADLGDPQIDATLQFVASRSTEADRDSTTSFSIGSATSDGQRFRVLRPHARGGLGAVFVALDGELNREVALKQILDHHADDPASRHRFLVEAEVTGGLEHPGIVPVYGLGTYADGRPFYAMRFIQGDSLKEAIAAFHADAAPRRDPRPAARWSCASSSAGSSTSATRSSMPTRGACSTATSSRATSSSASTARPWSSTGAWPRPTGKSDPAADERTLMPSSASGSAETLPGSAVGTPAYMSPEQARGDLEALGPRSDVYSPGGHALLPADRQAAVRGGRHRRDPAARPEGRVPAAPAGRPDDRPLARGRLPEGDGDEAGGPLRELPGAGRRHRALAGRRAGDGASRAVARTRLALGAQAPGRHERGRRDPGDGPGGRALWPGPRTDLLDQPGAGQHGPG